MRNSSSSSGSNIISSMFVTNIEAKAYKYCRGAENNRK